MGFYLRKASSGVGSALPTHKSPGLKSQHEEVTSGLHTAQRELVALDPPQVFTVHTEHGVIWRS